MGVLARRGRRMPFLSPQFLPFLRVEPGLTFSTGPLQQN